MPQRAGDPTRLPLPLSSRLFDFAHLPRISQLARLPDSDSPSVGGDRWGHHVLVERLWAERSTRPSRPGGNRSRRAAGNFKKAASDFMTVHQSRKHASGPLRCSLNQDLKISMSWSKLTSVESQDVLAFAVDGTPTRTRSVRKDRPQQEASPQAGAVLLAPFVTVRA